MDKIEIKTETGVHIIEHQELITYVQPQALYELLIHNLNVGHVHKHSHANTHTQRSNILFFGVHLILLSSISSVLLVSK